MKNITNGTAAPIVSTTPAPTSRQDSPASIMIASPVAAISTAVPRSGWWATKSVGAAISNSGTSSHQLIRALSADMP